LAAGVDGFGFLDFGVFISMTARNPGAAACRENQRAGLWGLMLKQR
jgi:hypothetical protein